MRGGPTARAVRRGQAPRGVAAIEFVIVLPVLLVLFFGMINITQYVAMNRKINAAAELVADLVTRHNGIIANTDIDDYFTAVSLALRPLDAANVRVQLYDYYLDANGIQTRWSKSSPGTRDCTVPQPATDTSLSTLITNGQNASDVVVAVVCMPFQLPSNFPGVSEFLRNITIEKRAVLKPRQSTTLTCMPTTPTNCP